MEVQGKVVLIAGLVPYDSGKTWFTVGTALATAKRGFMVRVFKPVAGHNIWYSPRTFKASLKLGLLVGNDILEYYKAGLAENPALSNPIAMATIPPDPMKYTKLDQYFNELESVASTAVLTRIYNCKKSIIEHYVHPENVEKASNTCREVIHRLSNALNAVPKPFTEIVNYLTSPKVEDDLDECLSMVMYGRELVFVEGFNDAIAAYPRLLERSSLVVVVAPGKILVYDDPNSVKRVIEKAVEEHGVEGFRTRYVVDVLKPRLTFETGLAHKPGPSRIHVDFVENVLMRLLRS